MHGNACTREGAFGHATNIGPDASGLIWAARALTMERLCEVQVAARAAGEQPSPEQVRKVLRWVDPPPASLPLPIIGLKQLRDLARTVYCRATVMPVIGIAEDGSGLVLPDGQRVTRTTLHLGCRGLFDTIVQELGAWFGEEEVKQWVEEQEGPTYHRPIRYDDKQDCSPGYYAGTEELNNVEELQVRFLSPLVIERKGLHSPSIEVCFLHARMTS